MAILKNISKTYNDKLVLDKINLAINSGDRIALIGENGAGKTTLLKVLLGEIQPDEGQVDIGRELVGYVPQEPTNQGESVHDSFVDSPKWRIDYALSLVMLENVTRKKVSELSGGQKTKLALAQVLAKQPRPTILLLDEPTNNLDEEGLVWLERFILDFEGSVLLVSHDRAFINNVASTIIELKDGELSQYGGNYDFYKYQKEIEYQSQLKKYEKNVGERRQLHRVLGEKQDRARKGLRNQKMRDNDKQQFDWHQNSVQRSFSSQVRAMQSRIEQLEEVERPETIKEYTVNLSSGTTHNKKLFELKKLQKSIGGKQVLQDVSLTVRGAERWHIQGANGAGKTTLLQILAGNLSHNSGEVKRADNLSVGYFSQDVNELPSNQRVLHYLQKTGANNTDIYRQAMSMGLSERELAKKIRELSRGQQSKLIFTNLLLGKNDVLLFDEPTNHLDIPTKERLESTLNKYNGGLIVASHDRYFIKTINITDSLLLS